MHKTLGNEKEQYQIKFCKKLPGELTFSQVTKNLKMFYFTWLDWASAQKVRLHHSLYIYIIYIYKYIYIIFSHILKYQDSFIESIF